MDDDEAAPELEETDRMVQAGAADDVEGEVVEVLDDAPQEHPLEEHPQEEQPVENPRARAAPLPLPMRRPHDTDFEDKVPFCGMIPRRHAEKQKDQNDGGDNANDEKNKSDKGLTGNNENKAPRQEETNDSMFLKQIIEESLANHGEETHSVEYDKATGRLLHLSLGTTLAAPFDHHWDLSPKIRHLEALQSLTLTSCRFLPEEVGELQELRKLTLIGCKRLESLPVIFSWTQDIDEDDGRKHLPLEELRILGIVPMVPPFLLSQVSGLPKLRVLQYSFHALCLEEELQYLRALLPSQNAHIMSEDRPHYSFTTSLQELILNRCHISTRGMEVLLLELVPHFPELKILSLCKNEIKSLEGIATEISNSLAYGNTTTHQPLGLEELILSDNPIWSDIHVSLVHRGGSEEEHRQLTPSQLQRAKKGKKEKAVQQEREQKSLELLLIHKAQWLHYLGFKFEKSKLWTPMIQHWLDVNKCGRHLLAPKENGNAEAVEKASDTVDEKGGVCDKMLPLWALIFSRASRHFSKAETIFVGTEGTQRCCLSPQTRESNAAYYLLRNGPALAERKGGFVKPVDQVGKSVE